MYLGPVLQINTNQSAFTIKCNTWCRSVLCALLWRSFHLFTRYVFLKRFFLCKTGKSTCASVLYVMMIKSRFDRGKFRYLFGVPVGFSDIMSLQFLWLIGTSLFLKGWHKFLIMRLGRDTAVIYSHQRTHHETGLYFDFW